MSGVWRSGSHHAVGKRWRSRETLVLAEPVFWKALTFLWGLPCGGLLVGPASVYGRGERFTWSAQPDRVSISGACGHALQAHRASSCKAPPPVRLRLLQGPGSYKAPPPT